MDLKCRVDPDDSILRLAKAFDYEFTGEIVTEIPDLPELPEDFSIGLIVGPSGGGKSTLLKTLGQVEEPPWWPEKPVFSRT